MLIWLILYLVCFISVIFYYIVLHKAIENYCRDNNTNNPYLMIDWIFASFLSALVAPMFILYVIIKAIISIAINKKNDKMQK